MKYGLFFACVAFPCLVQATDTQAESLLTGLFINQKESTEQLTTYKDGNKYYMPYKLILDESGLTPTQEGDRWVYTTPLGKGSIPDSAFQTFNNQTYIDLSALQNIAISAQFDSSAYAIKLDVPWNKNWKTVAKKVTEKPNIDYYPESVGLSGVSLDGGYSWQKSGKNNNSITYRYMNLGATGQLLGGFWGTQLNWSGQVNSPSNNQIDVYNLYWTKSTDKMAWRIGTNSPSFDTGGSRTFSGISIASSNQSIGRHLSDLTDSSTSLLQSSSEDYQTITGEGPAGGIAELRIDGQPVARVRIPLNKEYEFRNLNGEQLANNQHNIEIALYAHSLSEAPVEIIPYQVNERRSNAATGELILEGGIGKSDNIFSKDYNSQNSSDYAYAYAEYGLTNSISARFGVSDILSNSEKPASLIGLNFGLSPNLNWDISYQQDENNNSISSALNYSDKDFTASYYYDHLDNLFTSVISENHQLYTYYSFNKYFSLSNTYNYLTASDTKAESYFTTTANIIFNNALSANFRRDRYNDYSYNIYWRTDHATSLNLSGDKDSNGLFAHYTMNPELSFDSSLQKATGISALYYEAGLSYTPNGYDGNNSIYLSAHTYQSQLGYQADWRYQLNSGLNINLGYQKNNVGFNALELDGESFDQDYFYLNFSLDLFNSPASGLILGRNTYTQEGSILANIHYSPDFPIDKKDIVVTLDNQPVRGEKLIDGQYLINNLRPGTYTMRLNDKNLPLEYSASDLPALVVKIGKGSTTVVPYYLQASFGVSGQLEDTSKEVAVAIYQDNKQITQTESDIFGYYQLVGLKPGKYEIRAAGYKTQPVIITNDFIFSVDLSKQ